MKLWKKVLISIVGVVLLLAIGVFFVLRAPDSSAEKARFIVPLSSASPLEKLRTEGFVRYSWPVRLALTFKGVATIEPGGYELSKSMNAWEIAGALKKEPYMKWVVIPEGLRKEEIAELLAKNLRWSEATKQKWITVDTAKTFDQTEGVYFPDTYLIPLTETGPEIADRMRTHFQEKFAPYAKEAIAQNIRWDTVVKIASLIQREAAGKSDMPLIAGVIWNRLLIDMKLDIDATLQYARGDKGQGWWAPITAEEKKLKSPYNTYINKGLPPHPIANPGIEAIAAVLSPAKTECLFYLHDKSKNIHCAKTFEEHKQNIENLLK